MKNRETMKAAAAMCALVVAALLLLAATGQAQDAQYSDWGPAVNLGPVVNNSGAEQGPAVSKDGLSLYFHWSLTGLGDTDIYVSQRKSVDDPWGPPQKLGPNINSPYADANPELSPDGHWLYFQSNRPGGFGGSDLYVSRRHNKKDDFDWEPAVNLGPGVNSSARERSPAIFEDENTGVITLYFDSNRSGGMGGTDIYASTLQPDETFGPAVLVTELSGPWEDAQPGIRRDGLEIFIASNRPGGIGSDDLWVSTRASTSDPWSEPANLGPLVNFVGLDSQASLSFDGTTLYFASAERPENVGGKGFLDLWMTTRTKLKE